MLSFTHLASTYGVKESGEQAINVLWIILWLPILARVGNLSIARALMPLRKELGILMGTLAVVHGLGYILPYPAYIISKDFWIYDGYPSTYAW